MQLNQPIPPPYAGGDGQFDFILNGNQKPKKTLIPQANSRKKRILFAAVGGGILLLLAIILIAILSSSGKAATKTLTALAQTQTEIIRVSTDGSQHARGLPAQSYSATVQAAITTNEQQTVQYLATKKVKLKDKDLAKGQNAKTDAALKSADQAGRYDEELVSILEKSVAAYRNDISKAYKASSSKGEKQLLQKLFDQTTILIKNQPATNS